MLATVTCKTVSDMDKSLVGAVLIPAATGDGQLSLTTEKTS